MERFLFRVSNMSKAPIHYPLIFPISSPWIFRLFTKSSISIHFIISLSSFHQRDYRDSSSTRLTQPVQSQLIPSVYTVMTQQIRFLSVIIKVAAPRTLSMEPRPLLNCDSPWMSSSQSVNFQSTCLPGSQKWSWMRRRKTITICMSYD